MSHKEEYVITEEWVNEIREDFKTWATFLNSGVGMLSFTLGVACLGTNVPWFNAALSMIVVVCVRVQGKHYFPPAVKKIKNKAKTDDGARILIKGLEGEFLGFKALFSDYPIFVIGFLFLCFVTSSPIWVRIFPWLGPYFGN